MNQIADKWNDGDSYEYFMGRWSSLMAGKFLNWLHIPPNKKWLDVGCGTGALSKVIENQAQPTGLSAIDPSPGYVEEARQRIKMTQSLVVGNVENLPFDDKSFDVVVSGLALNFFPRVDQALLELKRVAKPSGTIAAYVWDYSGKMEFLRLFWDAAYQIEPESKKLDEGLRFPICNSDELRKEFTLAGLRNVESSFLDIETVFKDFEDYWNPFLGGQGPAPAFLQSLNENQQEELKDLIREQMHFEADGSIRLIARALVVRGMN